MRSAAIEGVADGVLVRMKAIRADLRRADHALAQILDKQVRSLTVALAGAVADDRLGGADIPMNVYWSPLWLISWRSTRFCFLPTIAPDFVQFQSAGANANHHAVMQFGAAASNAVTKAHDGIAVNAGNALSGADALAFGEAGDDCNLLVAGKVVHEAHPLVKDGFGET